MTDFPRPPNDNGIGLHDDARAGNQHLPFMLGVIDAMADKGFKWLKILTTVDNNKVELARHARRKRMMPIVRPFRQPCHPKNLNLYPDFIRAWVDAGCPYFEVGNEPNLILECTKDDYRKYSYEGCKFGVAAFAELLANQWLHNADLIRNNGGIPLFPAMSPTGYTGPHCILHHELYRLVLEVLKNRNALEWAFEGAGVAIHNRPCQGMELDVDDKCAFGDFRWIEKIFQRYLGRDIPLFATEAGYEGGMVTDWFARNGTLSPSHEMCLWKHKELNHEIFNRMNPAHPKAWEDYLITQCMWLTIDGVWLGAGWVQNAWANGGESYAWHDMDQIPSFTRWEGPPVEPPEPPIEPEPPEEDRMIKAYNCAGGEIPLESLQEKYRFTIEGHAGAGFYLVEIRERCEAANCDVWVQDIGGNATGGILVNWGWPGTMISKETEPNGKAGWAMTHSAYYLPPNSGPHFTNIGQASEMLRGIGMLAGTVHCTVNPTFRYFDNTPEPPPEPPPQPEPGEGEILGYNLASRLKQAPRGFSDDRAEIEAFSDLGACGEASREFGDIMLFVLHHTTSEKPDEPVAIARWAVEECTTVDHRTAPYHFMIMPNGTLHWTAKLIYTTRHCAGYNYKSVGAAFVDDCVDGPPTLKALETMRFLYWAIAEFLGQGWDRYRVPALMPHFYLVDTLCPGQAWEALMWGSPEHPSEWPMLPEPPRRSL